MRIILTYYIIGGTWEIYAMQTHTLPDYCFSLPERQMTVLLPSGPCSKMNYTLLPFSPFAHTSTFSRHHHHHHHAATKTRRRSPGAPPVPWQQWEKDLHCSDALFALVVY